MGARDINQLCNWIGSCHVHIHLTRPTLIINSEEKYNVNFQ